MILPDMEPKKEKSPWVALGIAAIVVGLGIALVIIEAQKPLLPPVVIRPHIPANLRTVPPTRSQPPTASPTQPPTTTTTTTTVTLPQTTTTVPPQPASTTSPLPLPSPEERAARAKRLEDLLRQAEEKEKNSLWTGALSLLELARSEFPESAGRIDPSIKRVRDYLEASLYAADKALKRARAALQQSLLYDALEAALSARNHVPDVAAKIAEIDSIRDEIRFKRLWEGMVRIPGGKCLVGSNLRADHPEREIELKTFWMDVHEVTVGEYRLYLLDTAAKPPPQWKPLAQFTPEELLLPAQSITYPEAVAYASWTGRRLPTEVEWERAARFIDGRVYPWGNEPMLNGQLVANHLRLEAGRGVYGHVQPVGKFPNGGSAEGVLDLAGNVWEWTSTEAVYEMGGRKYLCRILKGGSFLTPPDAGRGWVRLLEEPEVRQIDVGFRCVRDGE